MATEPEPQTDEAAESPTKVPRPVGGGTMVIESLGRFVDNLLGASRRERETRDELEPMLLRDEEMPDDPPPEEAPPPVPDGEGQITKGRKPDQETRTESDDE